MEKDNKVVLGAVLILLVGMLSFNFAGSLTGKTVNKGGPDVVLTVSPSNVYFSFEDSHMMELKLHLLYLKEPQL